MSLSRVVYAVAGSSRSGHRLCRCAPRLTDVDVRGRLSMSGLGLLTGFQLAYEDADTCLVGRLT